MNNEERKIGLLSSNIDFWTIGIYLLLVVCGWVSIYSVTNEEAGEAFSLSTRYGKQLIWMGVSLVAGLSIVLIDTKYFHIFCYPAYWLALGLMLVVLLFGREVNGAKSWLSIGSVRIQPVEFMKIATAMALARFMSSPHFNIQQRDSLFKVACIIFIPVVVVLMQNDTGSALVFAAFFIILFREGFGASLYLVCFYWFLVAVLTFFLTPFSLALMVFVSCVLFEVVSNFQREGVVLAMVRYVALVAAIFLLLFFGFRLLGWGVGGEILLLLAVLATLPILIKNFLRGYSRTILNYTALFVVSVLLIFAVDYAFNNILQAHQKNRILDLVGIQDDPQGVGYNAMQAKIAIGSGGLSGKGFLQGTQTRFSFVPEQSTDFIFCTVGEEHGFIGSVIVVALFVVLILRLLKMGERQNEPFARIYCYGVAAVIFAHFFINIAMAIGLFPVIGIPLPFFSYGGSSLLAFSVMFFIAVRLDSLQFEGTGRKLL